MLRTLALVLLLANALLLAALSGVFEAGADAEREPERLQRQQQSGLVRILSPQAASAAIDAAGAASLQAAAAASSALATVCLEAGPFSAADAAVAERSLHDAGLAPGSWQVQRQDDGGAFMIYMGRYADRETLQRKLAELKRMKLSAEDLRGAPALQPGINLGHFDNLANANAALAQMAQRGLRTARVITLRQAQSQTMLRVPAADATQRARLAGLQLPREPGFLPCATAAVVAAVPASSAASTPASGQASSAPALAPASASAPATAAVPASAPPPPAKPSATAPTNPAAGASTRAALARAVSAVAAEAGTGAAVSAKR